MAIFHGYVKEPEGISIESHAKRGIESQTAEVPLPTGAFVEFTAHTSPIQGIEITQENPETAADLLEQFGRDYSLQIVKINVFQSILTFWSFSKLKLLIYENCFGLMWPAGHMDRWLLWLHGVVFRTVV